MIPLKAECRLWSGARPKWWAPLEQVLLSSTTEGGFSYQTNQYRICPSPGSPTTVLPSPPRPPSPIVSRHHNRIWLVFIHMCMYMFVYFKCVYVFASKVCFQMINTWIWKCINVSRNSQNDSSFIPFRGIYRYLFYANMLYSFQQVYLTDS